DAHRAKVHGRCEPTTGIEPSGRLVAQVMTAEPYASAKRVLWIVDNGSSHRGQASIDRLQERWPRLRLIHLPVHASWLNQAEIYLSVVQRKVLTPNDFADLATSNQVVGVPGPLRADRHAVRGSSPAPTWTACPPAPPARPFTRQPDRHRRYATETLRQSPTAIGCPPPDTGRLAVARRSVIAHSRLR
ncbi:MAG: transposase, partial [Egibacteraceae bacterium]